MSNTKFTPRTDAEREQWKAMCERVAARYIVPPPTSFNEAFDAIVAPVPRVLRSVTLSNGHTYRVKDGVLQRQNLEDEHTFSDFPLSVPSNRADVAVINDLYENPDEPAPAAPALTRQQCVEALVAMGAESYNAGELSYSVQLPPLSTVLILPREVTP